MKPVIVLVGRPNVGKSTLFNRLTRSRAALVADAPGLTRDRQYGDGRIGDRPYLVIDTGGVPGRLDARGGALARIMSAQTRQAIAEADAVILVVDARAGLASADRDLAEDLRRSGKVIHVAVNKAEGMDPDVAAADFHKLGVGAPSAISAEHGDGVAAFMERVLAGVPVVPEVHTPEDIPRVAVIGRPNVGKSTLVNALLGEERVVVFDEAGTTRDAIRIPFERDGRSFVLIDTAGVRRRARIDEAIEKFSVVKTLQAIDQCDVCILVLDAAEGVTDQDVALAGYVLEEGRALVLVANKWDVPDAAQRAWVRREIERKLPFVDYVRVHYASAREHTGLDALFGSVLEAFDSARRPMPTGRLNRLLAAAIQATAPPIVRGRRIKPKYAHQGGKSPPTIVIHGNLVSELPDSYRRYLAKTFRKAFRLMGTPVRIECRDEENPYRPKVATRRQSASGSRRSVKKRL
jgi:GTP-binding protein